MLQEKRDFVSDKFFLCPHERDGERRQACCRAAVCGDNHSFGFCATSPMVASLSTIRLSRSSSLCQLQNFKRATSETTTSCLSFLNKVLRVESPEVLWRLLKTTELITEQIVSEHTGASELISQSENQLLRVVTGVGVVFSAQSSHTS